MSSDFLSLSIFERCKDREKDWDVQTFCKVFNMKFHYSHSSALNFTSNGSVFST